MTGPPEIPEEKDIRTNIVPQPNYDRPEERRPEVPRQPEPSNEPREPDQPRIPEIYPNQHPDQPRQPWETREQPGQPETHPEEPKPWETPEQPRQTERYPEPQQHWDTPKPTKSQKPSKESGISWFPWQTPDKEPEPETNVIDSNHEEIPETTYKSSEPSPTPPQIVNVRVGEETATVQGEKDEDGSVVVDTGDLPKNEWTKVNEKPSNCQPGFEVDEYGACYGMYQK